MSNYKTKNSIPIIFDRKKILYKNFDKIKLYKNIAHEISQRLNETTFSYNYGIEINSKSNEAHSIINKSNKINNLYRTSLHSKNLTKNLDIVCDEELLPLKNNGFNLIFSILGLNLINDLPGTLKQIHDALKPNGLFIATFWGQGTLIPLSESLAYADEKILGGLYQRTYPFCDIKTLGNLMQRAGFNNPVADVEKIIYSYKNIIEIIYDIRRLSEKNILSARKKSFTPKSIFKEAEKYLYSKHSEKSEIKIPYNIVFVSGWKK